MEIQSVAFGPGGEIQVEWVEEVDHLFYRHAVVIPPVDSEEEGRPERLAALLVTTAEELLTLVQSGVDRGEDRPYDNPEDVERRG